MLVVLFIFSLGAIASGADLALEQARDAEDRAALDRIATQLAGAAQKQPGDAAAQYRAALAQSYIAEVAIELRDKNQAHSAAEAGIKIAERAVALKPEASEYHRVLGTLCGQAISANVLQGLKYGHCASDEVTKAIQLDPKAALNYLSRGIGSLYLPPALGGGVEIAIKDFQKALELEPKSSEVHLWLGMAYRKLERNADARREFQKSLESDPARIWTKQQLEKTPANP